MIQHITLSIEIAVAALAISFLVAVLVGQAIAAGSAPGAYGQPPRTLQLAAAREQARPGEAYSGTSVDPITERATHLYVLPGTAEADWDNANDWAIERGGSLPDLDELPRVIEATGAAEGRYWSRERSKDDPNWAFIYDASEKMIDDERVDAELLAVVVRHVIV